MPVLHADIRAKRARCFSGLPPLNNADQGIRTVPPPAARHWWFLYADEYKKHPSPPAFDAFCPALVPAIHRERPGEIRQEADRTGSRIPQVTQRHLQIRNPAARFAPVGAPVKLNPVAADYSSVPPLVTLHCVHDAACVFCSGPRPPAGKPVPHAEHPQHAARQNGATANIPTKPRLTGNVPLQAGFCRCHYRLCFRSRIEKNGGFHAVRDDFRAANRQTVSHRADILTVQCFSTTSSRSFLLFRRLRGWDCQHHLCRCRAGCTGIRHPTVGASGMKFISCSWPCN